MSQEREGAEIAELSRTDAAARDGIGEEDHAIPLWFNVGFYGLIGFGILYILWYAGISGWSQLGQYQAELAAADARYSAERAEHVATNNPYHGDAAAIAEGKQVFETICLACHLVDGTGLVGPSLVDPYWKYGGSDAALFETVNAGRPLGMPPWGPQLGNEKIWQVLAYIETLPKRAEPGVGSPEFEAARAAPAAAPSGGGG